MFGRLPASSVSKICSLSCFCTSIRSETPLQWYHFAESYTLLLFSPSSLSVKWRSTLQMHTQGFIVISQWSKKILHCRCIFPKHGHGDWRRSIKLQLELARLSFTHYLGLWGRQRSTTCVASVLIPTKVCVFGVEGLRWHSKWPCRIVLTPMACA